MDRLTPEEWANSQAGEASYWRGQFAAGNPEQRGRNDWYRNVTHPTFFREHDFAGEVVADVGSGPEGILHVIEGAAGRYAVDPLMVRFEEIGYDTRAHDVKPVVGDAEAFELPRPADVVLCLNALDHMRDPSAALEAIHRNLRTGGLLVLCVDLRPPELRDELHKLILTEQRVRDWLNERGYAIQDWRIVPHQAPNPTQQLCVVATALPVGKTTPHSDVRIPGLNKCELCGEHYAASTAPPSVPQCSDCYVNRLEAARTAQAARRVEAVETVAGMLDDAPPTILQMPDLDGLAEPERAEVRRADCCAQGANNALICLDGRWHLAIVSSTQSGGKTRFTVASVPVRHCPFCGEALDDETPTRRQHSDAVMETHIEALRETA